MLLDMNKRIKKHDPLVKKFLKDINAAREFVEIHLPLEIRNKCDLSSIRVEPGSYVEDDLKIHFSDIVYRINLLQMNGVVDSCIYVYVLVEHQSGAEILMPLRVLRYQIAIIQEHLKNHPQDVSSLPLVVPIVFYNGKKSPYPYNCNIASLFADLELYKKMPLGSFNLVDLTVMEDEEILRHKKIALLEVVSKHIHGRNFTHAVALIMQALNIAYTNELDIALVGSALRYLLDARDKEEIDPLIKQISNNIPFYKDAVMSYSDTLRQEGRQEGRQETQKELALEFLRSGVDSSIVAKAAHLTLAQIEELKKVLK